MKTDPARLTLSHWWRKYIVATPGIQHYHAMNRKPIHYKSQSCWTNIWEIVWNTTKHFKACVHYFHQIFIFSSNDSPSKAMKNAFYFIKKVFLVLEIFNFLYFCPSLFFYQPAIALEDDRRKILKFMTSSIVKTRAQ